MSTPTRMVIKACQIDEKGNQILESIISDKAINIPNTVDEFGYSHQESLCIVNNIINTFLATQGDLKKSET